jgi:hypothetical protein
MAICGFEISTIISLRRLWMNMFTLARPMQLLSTAVAPVSWLPCTLRFGVGHEFYVAHANDRWRDCLCQCIAERYLRGSKNLISHIKEYLDRPYVVVVKLSDIGRRSLQRMLLFYGIQRDLAFDVQAALFCAPDPSAKSRLFMDHLRRVLTKRGYVAQLVIWQAEPINVVILLKSPEMF